MSNIGNTESQAFTQGVHHVGLTVHDALESSNFFIDTLGFKKVGEKPDYPAIFVSDGTIMLTLWQAIDSDSAKSFDRKNNIGLHHLALHLKDDVAIEDIHKRLLDTPNVSIEFPPEQLGNGTTKHMMCITPGGIRLELIAPTT